MEKHPSKIIRQRIYPLSVRQKLMWSTSLVTILPVIALFGIIIFRSMHANLENTRRQAQITLDKAAGELELWHSQALERAVSLALDMNVQNEIQNYLHGGYQEQQEVRGFLYNRLMTLYTSDMKILNTCLYVSEARKTFYYLENDLYEAYHQESWFQDLLSGKITHYQGYGPSLTEQTFFTDGKPQITYKPAILIATGMINIQTGQTVGFTYVELDEEKLYDAFRSLVQGSRDAVLIGDKIICGGEQPPVHYISVRSRVEGLDLEVEYRLDLRQLMRGYLESLGWLVVGLLGLAFLLHFVIRCISDWFSGRIVLLSNATKRIAEGNLEVQVTDPCQDELAELADSLNRMARDMKRLIEKNYLGKIENQKMTLRALQNQINPHFIYNTLESISMLALIQNNYEIVDLVQAFSHMMRYSMQEEMLVSVREEIENIRNFEAIQKIRFPDKFYMIYEISPDSTEERLPRLSLQPLVENAFKHGSENGSRQMRVVISVKKMAGDLKIRIFNNGVPIPPERIRQIRLLLKKEKPSDSLDCFALQNINRRLKLAYGNQTGFFIGSRQGTGTLVSLKIPLTPKNQEGFYEKGFNL